ncbi:hypothetical protein E2562_010865 [Oryza meyeriana var. granulata]|uniref:Uncharacterized protein n=1 Tax=Oryza meyeriana var. granulata TaxID=110450 RepID=A0A6G1BJT6_9ORYZ|nr:hypothetical protein E2562_010865 [Oryza meyeriana var. granulata]
MATPSIITMPAILLGAATRPSPLLFSSAALASHSSRVSRRYSPSLPYRRPFKDSLYTLKRLMASITDIVVTSPHCLMVLTMCRNLSGTECKSFTTTTLSSTLVQRTRISFTVVVSFKAYSLIVSESPISRMQEEVAPLARVKTSHSSEVA